jgi:LacI family transcriptional regulator
LLALSKPPDAIAAASDMCAIGAVLAIEEAGLSVPEDIAVTGCDDAPFAQLLRPPLTTVRQDAFGLGRAAADGILKMLDEPDSPPPAILLPTELVVRESCGIEVRRSASTGEG